MLKAPETSFLFSPSCQKSPFQGFLKGRRLPFASRNILTCLHSPNLLAQPFMEIQRAALLERLPMPGSESRTKHTAGHDREMLLLRGKRTALPRNWHQGDEF